MLDRIFPSRRRSTVAPRKRRGERLHLQRLEERLALAIEVFQYPMAGVLNSTSASSNYAVLLMDDGTTGFLKKNATPSPTFTYANNSQFLDDPTTTTEEAITFGELLSNWGTLSSFYVTSGKRIDYAGSSIPATFLGKDVFIDNVDPLNPFGPKPIDLGTSDGIVPGTFRATASIVDKDGKFAFVQLLASKPGDNWNMTVDKISGDGAAPSLAFVSETTGSVVLRFADAPQSVSLSPISWGVYTGARQVVGTTGTPDVKPLSFTLFPGQNVTQRFLVDLSRNESTISLNSPLLATRGSGSDPGFFSAAGDVVQQAGQVVLDGSTIVTNANVSSADLFTVGVPMWVNQTTVTGDTTRIPVRNTTVNRPVAAPSQQLILEGVVGAPGRLLVSEQGALANSLTTPGASPAGLLDVQASHADVIFAGTVNATQQTYLLQSPLDPRAYSFTTVSPTTGVQSGTILGGTVGVTLANDAGGEMNVRTTINTLRMTAASTASQPALPYAINVADSDSLTVDAVPASSRPIAIDAAAALTVTSAVTTSGDLALGATTKLTMSGPISSAAGNVTLRSNAITATVPVTAGGTRNVSIQSTSATGDVVLDGLVQAGGGAKAPVRAATTANVDLATGGLLVVDGVALVAGDRVLVKNQTSALENGIYVASAGAWTRAADASVSQLFVPGFTTAVREGAQQGAWTFANPAIPTLDQTAIAFVPASAVQTYVPARVATTANVNLAAGGLLTVDGVALAAGDRVLVRSQSNPRQNGLYVADAGPWVRASDANTVAELLAGSYVFVTEGATTGQKGYVLADDAVQVGNTPLNFNLFTVQATRTNNYSPARIQSNVVAATTLNVDLAAPPAEIDGVTLVANDLVLVKNQFDAAANGIYIFTGASLQRWSGANSSAALPRGTVVYVEQGATNGSSSWTFDDTIDFLGRTTANSLQVTGLPSTLALASGMLVTGPGIPADTRIDLVLSNTSVRLTKAALLTSSTAVLSFMQTAAVAVGTTPLLFVPSGGTAAVTAGQSITSTASASSRVTASTAVLTAGRPTSGTGDTASLISVNSALGRLVAGAPASISVNDSGAIDLFDVRTSTAGDVIVNAQGTITARSLIATGTTASPADVTLTSQLGDVVAASVSSSVGSINLNSPNERVVVRTLGLNPGAVVAQNGDVTAIANGGGILVAGQVQALGADGDITFQSNQAGLTTIAPASITATDRLTVTTPNAVPALGAGTTVSAQALTLTSQFGASQTPPAGFGTFSTVNFNRTDAGSIVYSSPAALTVEAATTVLGDIALTAPSLQVAGAITAATATPGDGQVRLTATAGNIGVAAPITAGGDRVTLTAATGVITPSGTGEINSQTLVWTATTSPLPGLTGTFSRVGSNLTAPGSLTLGSAASPIVIVGASTVSGPITITGSNVRIVDVVRANGGDPVSVTATAGNIEFVANTLGGIVSLPAASTTGAITLTAPAGQVIGANKATRTTARGGPLAVSAQAADIKTNVSSLTSTTSLGGLTASAVGALTLGDILAAGQNVSLDAVSGVSQPTGGIVTAGLSVANGSGVVNLSSTANSFAVVSLRNGSGDVFLTNSGSFTAAGNGVSTGTAAPGDGDITLTANGGGSIVLEAGVTAAGDRVTLNAAGGSILQSAGIIDSQTLVWYATTPPSLAGTYTDIGSNLTSAGNLALAVGPTQRVLATSTVNGSITITGPSVTISEPVTAGGAGSGVTVQATAGDITFQPATTATPSVAAPFGGVTLLASGQIDAQYGRVSGQTIASTSGGTLFVGTMQSTSTTTIVTTAGGGVSVSPQPNGLLQAGGTLDLSQVQGQIRIRNGGLIIGNPLVLGGKTVQFATVTTPAELVGAVNAVNLLPSVPGSTYEIIVGATMTLTQTLTIDRPVTFRGTSSSIVLSGSPSVTSGLVLTSGASGSTVRDIAFSNFTGTAVRATSLSGLTISGINVLNSGTGVSLSSVTNSLVGGTGAGQGNTFTNNSREGIFASGVCVNTQLVKNSFPGTTTKYNLSSSRGITVVN
jgi:hypothetical protein